MTALLVLLNAQCGALLVYAANEWRSARHYRKQNLQAQVDELVYADLMARLVMRRDSLRRPVIAGVRKDEHRDSNGDARADVAEVSHESSFRVSS